MRTLSEATKKSLDEELFEYNSIAYEIALRKLEIETTREQDENVGGGKSGYISKIPESLVIKYSEDSRIQYLEKLRSDIEQLYHECTEEQRLIIDLRWLLNESNTWEEVATKIHCSEKSVYRKREKILERYAKIKGKM
ncbi:DUF722 domain-containing protein [Enterococcus gallinarum]|uniref:DUF722 domain-containing protein n=1 Tax=Enterococcus gallinarum TaxID=1353 RepID=A0A6I4XFD7_ENTGA|nr:DUF722 domain-containing protein [Enterococcus gallinarum]DAG74563.1 MAG TPA: transcriptional activator [Caudoviricetes sp.]MCR1932635.1 DUF722 domain-containing protein [Enterococcus gallinarum]MDT2679844.1 DUF722 domain-containing protein [Enterococcus gallinarum]MDV7787660.1 DUF722 domain-containing protein [Enterococcus gallinarum]MXS25276.1 DUF722 domain-containing protein [Enterococcus gallinarum]